MADNDPVPVAQYLRMSTDQQQYSLVNQAAAIAKYAERNSLVIVKSYEDAGRSGLSLRERQGLRALLTDVISRDVRYKAILVYDVSRWGRFQDTDEAATYEFLCKTAGAPVWYCAEAFSNDQSVASSIMKALKRAMAAEFSRELGVKCYEGEKRLAQLGFKMGGTAGFGLRRLLLSRTGKRIRILQKGEQKSVTNERVILIPGPPREVKAVRLIYKMLLQGTRPASITCELNRLGIKYQGDRPWNYYAVLGILRSPKYAGCNVWGQTSQKLRGKSRAVPRESWITVPGAFDPLVSTETYERAQRILDDKTINKSDEELIQKLRQLLRRKHYLSQQLIDKSRQVPAMNTYYRRFGSLRNVYQLVGYDQWKEYFNRRDKAVRTDRLRKAFVEQIANLFPEHVVSLHSPPKRRRSLLVDGSTVVSVYFCRSCHWPNGKPCWRFDPVAGETHNISLVCMMTATNDGVENFYLFRSLGRTGNYKFGRRSRWLRTAIPLSDVSKFYDAVTSIGGRD
jgi:DNA invertase Pin-like site-specific DNA recombinase